MATPVDKDKTGRVGLSEAVVEVVAGRPGTFGVYARNLVTDETISVNADRVLPAESAAKTFILVHYSRLVTSGAVDPTTRVCLDQDLRQIGTGVLRYLADGLEPTLDDLAWLMIIVSEHRDRDAVAGHRCAGRRERHDGKARVSDGSTQ
jgi:beta-lactamase class A